MVEQALKLTIPYLGELSSDAQNVRDAIQLEDEWSELLRLAAAFDSQLHVIDTVVECSDCGWRMYPRGVYQRFPGVWRFTALYDFEIDANGDARPLVVDGVLSVEFDADCPHCLRYDDRDY